MDKELEKQIKEIENRIEFCKKQKKINKENLSYTEYLKTARNLDEVILSAKNDKKKLVKESREVKNIINNENMAFFSYALVILSLGTLVYYAAEMLRNLFLTNNLLSYGFILGGLSIMAGLILFALQILDSINVNIKKDENNQKSIRKYMMMGVFLIVAFTFAHSMGFEYNTEDNKFQKKEISKENNGNMEEVVKIFVENKNLTQQNQILMKNITILQENNKILTNCIDEHINLNMTSNISNCIEPYDK